MGARPYDPALGRFLAVDPVDGGSLNSYDYAGQDPVNGYDLDGTLCVTCFARTLYSLVRTGVSRVSRHGGAAVRFTRRRAEVVFRSSSAELEVPT